MLICATEVRRTAARRTATGLAVAFLLLAPIAADAQERYRWPMDLPRVLTSSFGEYRSSGYHMGIDLRTGGIGKDVFAPASGHVERIRCSPYGYGKAVYFRTDDGYLFVYAHLNDYAEPLREFVRLEQHRAERYEVDLNPGKDRFRFERGQLLAYSGQTGIGAPHLHFEARNGAGVPIDPRMLGFDWPDTTAPSIGGVQIEPASPGVLLNGTLMPVTLRPIAGAAGLTTAGIRASGPVHFAIDATDSAGAQGTRLGIAGASVMAGSESVFAMTFAEIPYESYRDGVVAFHPYYRSSPRYLTLWPWPNNRVPAYARAEGPGTANPVTADKVTIRVRDAHANERAIAIPLELAPAPEDAAPAQAHSGMGTVRFEPVSTWLVCVVTFPAAEAETPTVRIEGGALSESAMTRVSGQEFQLAIAAAQDANRLSVAIAHPRVSTAPVEFAVFQRGRAPRAYERDGLRIEGNADTAFGTLIFDSTRIGPQKHGELTAVGDAYRIWHENHPLAEPVRVTMPIPEGADTTRVHVYRHGSGWSRLDSTSVPGGLTFETRQFGLFQAFEDRHAPFLRITSPPEGYAAQSKRPILKARVTDAHSEIDGYGATVNGQWLLVSYDPEHEELVWSRDEDLPSGVQSIEFWASDHAGNVTRKTVSVSVP